MILQFTSLIILNQSPYLTCTLFILGPHVRLKDREVILNDFKQLHSVTNRTEAHKMLADFYSTWEKQYTNLISHIRSIEKELLAFLAFLAFPAAIRPTIYSTNIIESGKLQV